MITTLVIVVFGVGLVSMTITLVTHGAVLVVRRRQVSSGPTPELSVLKPLKGASPDLYENLVSFARQDYPSFELVLGCEEASDPALTVARRVAREFPHVKIRIVAGGRPIGMNPKVNNLYQLDRVARFEHRLISDADVRVDPGYLRAVTAELADPSVGLVSNVIAGVGERTLGAALDNLHLNTFVARTVCGADVLAGHPCVVGKSMLFRHTDFERLGGWEIARDVLAEDYVLGRAFQAAGHRVALCPYVLPAVNPQRSVRDFFERHVRWGQMRRHLAPVLYVGEPLLLPAVWFGLVLTLMVLSPGALGVLQRPLAVTAAVGLLLQAVLDGLMVGRLRGSPLAAKDFVLVPVRDAIVFVVWLVAAFRSTVSWRGNTFLVGPGSVLTPERADADVVVAS